jgi:hypothetical protein
MTWLREQAGDFYDAGIKKLILRLTKFIAIHGLIALFLRHRLASTLTAFFVTRALGRHFSNRPTCWSTLSWLLELLLVGCGYSLLNSAHLSSVCLLSSSLCLFERGWVPVNLFEFVYYVGGEGKDG